jgi:AcrR family transcriptional regulator
MGRRSDHSRPELREMALSAAADIVAEAGLRALSTRRIATAIGYSAGTLYQLFADLDDLIVHLNVRTLDGFYAALSDVDLTGAPERILVELATRYIAYVTARPLLWDAVVDHRFADGRAAPPEYYASAVRLYGVAEAAIASLVADEAARACEARVLWAGLYGITALSASNKLGPGESVDEMVHALAETYVAGLRARYAGGRKALRTRRNGRR